jgi:hypothetical protein
MEGEFSTIQSCPWYLQFNGAAKYTGWKGIRIQAGNAFDKGTNFMEGYAQTLGRNRVINSIR